MEDTPRLNVLFVFHNMLARPLAEAIVVGEDYPASKASDVNYKELLNNVRLRLTKIR